MIRTKHRRPDLPGSPLQYSFYARAADGQEFSTHFLADDRIYDPADAVMTEQAEAKLEEQVDHYEEMLCGS